MKKYAIIVAGGTGSRMKGAVPKQFMMLNKKPIIHYSIEAFYSHDPSTKIILVIHPGFLKHWENLCLEYKTDIPFEIAKGGNTRFDSVKNGLQLIDEEGFVAIHDAARPLVDAGFIGYNFSEAEVYGSAVPGVKVNDTIRQIDGETSCQLDRALLRAIQTPQIFKVSEFRKAYMQSWQPVFTDDASVMEAAGFPIHLTEGKPSNIKLTLSQDIEIAEVLLRL